MNKLRRMISIVGLLGTREVIENELIKELDVYKNGKYALQKAD